MKDKRPPEQLTKTELEKRIRKTATKILRECTQAVIDGEYWMKLHPNEDPLDLEWFKVEQKKARDVLKQFGVEE